MRLLMVGVLCCTSVFGAKVVDVGERFKSSQSCKVCHKRIVDEWSTSWHAKSHYAKDEYFRKSMEYVSKKSHRSLNAVKVQCATCHNPRISVTTTDQSYEIASVMGLTQGSAVDKAVHDDTINEGINCVVCHNVDKIHDEYDASKRGINRVEWTKSGTMTGPYNDAKSPYHKTKHHDFMDKTPNKLCFVCHANDRSVKGLVFTNMQEEYGDTKQACVSCHMGKRHDDVAATYKFNGKEKRRMVRNHHFSGAHTQSMWKDALTLDLQNSGDKIAIVIKNPQPHNLPSGFGARELLVEVQFFNGHKVLKKEKISLTPAYTRSRGRVTIPHLAIKQTKEASIPAHGMKKLLIKKLKKADSVEVSIYYRLVNDEVKSILKLKDAIFSKRYLITSKRLDF